MKLVEILVERTLADVGVRGGKFYLSAKSETMDVPHFLKTGELEGVKGISSSRRIWAEFGPGVSRDIFIVMPAQETLRLNHLQRVGYTDADALIANNSKIYGRIFSVADVAKTSCDNMVTGTLKKMSALKGMDQRGGDLNAIMNNTQSIMWKLQREGDFDDERYKNVDTSKFGDWKANGLRLSSYDDYANLYYQAAKMAGWYGKGYVKFFAPQNRSNWLPALKEGIIAQANAYSEESEWVNEGTKLIVPRTSQIVLAVPEEYQSPEPEKDKYWNAFSDKRLAYYQNLMQMFSQSPFSVKIVDGNKTANSLVGMQAKRRLR
jgi:hypothetical protein